MATTDAHAKKLTCPLCPIFDWCTVCKNTAYKTYTLNFPQNGFCARAVDELAAFFAGNACGERISVDGFVKNFRAEKTAILLGETAGLHSVALASLTATLLGTKLCAQTNTADELSAQFANRFTFENCGKYDTVIFVGDSLSTHHTLIGRLLANERTPKIFFVDVAQEFEFEGTQHIILHPAHAENFLFDVIRALRGFPDLGRAEDFATALRLCAKKGVVFASPQRARFFDAGTALSFARNIADVLKFDFVAMPDDAASVGAAHYFAAEGFVKPFELYTAIENNEVETVVAIDCSGKNIPPHIARKICKLPQVHVSSHAETWLTNCACTVLRTDNPFARSELFLGIDGRFYQTQDQPQAGDALLQLLVSAQRMSPAVDADDVKRKLNEFVFPEISANLRPRDVQNVAVHFSRQSRFARLKPNATCAFANARTMRENNLPETTVQFTSQNGSFATQLYATEGIANQVFLLPDFDETACSILNYGKNGYEPTEVEINVVKRG